MTFRPRQPAASDRAAESVGPEVLAAGLSAIVLVVLVGFTLFGRVGSQGAAEPTTDPGALVPGSAQPVSSAAVVASPSPVTTPSTAPAASPTVSPTLTLPPTQGAWATDARVLLETEARLVEIRDELTAATGTNPRSADVIRSELQRLNPTLDFALRAIAAVERGGAPADLIADLRDVHQAALAASRETLGASLQNPQAYRTGGREVAAILAGLEVLISRIEAAAGLPSADPS